MKPSTLDQKVKDHYQQQKLSAHKIQHLMEMQSLQSEKDETRSWRQRWEKQRRLSIAALFMICILGGIVFSTPSPFDSLQTRISKEIAMNHNKHYEVDFVSNSFSQLNAKMHKLDFNLAFPKKLLNSGYKVLGARYCSIQGGIASQVKLQNSLGKTVTLYITQLTKELKPLDSFLQQHDKVTINTWKENELFFGLAETP